MELLQHYIAGLNEVIASGVDVRFLLHGGRSVPVIRYITVNEAEKCLEVWYLLNGRDRQMQIPVSTRFQIEFNDLPNDLRDASWK